LVIKQGSISPRKQESKASQTDGSGIRGADSTYETHSRTCVNRKDLSSSDILLRPLLDLMTPLDDEPSTIFEDQTSAEESVGLTPRCYDFVSTESTSEKSVVVMLRTRRGSVRGTVNDSTLGWKQHRGRVGSNYIVYR
jgi:hypothetical protein